MGVTKGLEAREKLEVLRYQGELVHASLNVLPLLNVLKLLPVFSRYKWN
jgi:hypothetical protein